jgi:hypothetical protein
VVTKVMVNQTESREMAMTLHHFEGVQIQTLARERSESES